MSSPVLNPYQTPVAAKLTAGEAADPKRRDIAVFVLLMVVTLGFYCFYLAYQWSKEVNALVERPKYQPAVVLLVTILTCGLAGIVFECLFAFDIAERTRARGVPGRIDQLATWVVVCNCLAVLLSLTTIGIVVALPLATLASVLVQVELNKLAEGYGAKC